MSHVIAPVLAQWARRYGLADPEAAADPIRRLDPSCAAAARAIANQVGAATDSSAHRIGASGFALRQAWSAEAPGRAVHCLARAAADLVEMCDRLATACGLIEEAITEGQREVDTAFRRAEADAAAVIAEPAVARFADLVESLCREEAERSIVTALSSAIAAVEARLDTVAARVLDLIEGEPQEVMTTDLLPTASRSQRVAAIDARNHLALGRDIYSTDLLHQMLAIGIDSALTRAADEGLDATLMTYHADDPAGQGGAAVVIGDLAAAHSVAVLVPGVGNSPFLIGDSLPLATALNSAATAAGGGPSATVLWFDYDIPLGVLSGSPTDLLASPLTDGADVLRTLGSGDAAVGGMRLASFVRTLRPLMSGGSRLTLIGHSYGSTTVSMAATDLGRGNGVDDVVLLGSPGAGASVTSATDYRAVPADDVFAVSFPRDPVPALGQSDAVKKLHPLQHWFRELTLRTDPGPFGADPADPGFGAHVIDAPSNVPGPKHTITGVIAGLVPDFSQHAITNYLAGDSLAAIGSVVAGRYSAPADGRTGR